MTSAEHTPGPSGPSQRPHIYGLAERLVRLAPELKILYAPAQYAAQ
jgi:hypothetical protein